MEPQSTKGRVLLACLQLFNERGVSNVTTAEIAATVGINQGNLYYYFKRKEQIVVALFDEFEQAMERHALIGFNNPRDQERYAHYLAGWFRLMWDYRLFYRDGASLYRVAPSLRERLKLTTDRGQQNLRRVMLDLNEVGILRAPAAEIDRLIVNSWVIAAYWLDYLQTREGVTHITQAHVDWGYAQVLSLFRPYLAKPQRASLGRMAPIAEAERPTLSQVAENGRPRRRTADRG